jgi:hypothetical protein
VRHDVFRHDESVIGKRPLDVVERVAALCRQNNSITQNDKP